MTRFVFAIWERERSPTIIKLVKVDAALLTDAQATLQLYLNQLTSKYPGGTVHIDSSLLLQV